jgi:Na+/H+ antiporter NhaA
LGAAGLIIRLLASAAMAERGWGLAARTAVYFCIGAVVMLGLRWAQR